MQNFVVDMFLSLPAGRKTDTGLLMNAGGASITLAAGDGPRDDHGRWVAVDQANNQIGGIKKEADKLGVVVHDDDDDRVKDASVTAMHSSDVADTPRSHSKAAADHFDAQNRAEKLAAKYSNSSAEEPAHGKYAGIIDKEQMNAAHQNIHSRLATAYSKLAHAHEDAGLDHEEFAGGTSLSLGMGDYEVLSLGDVAGHDFHGNQYTSGIAGQKTREFLNNDLRKGNNIISIAHRKVFTADNGELVKKHRGITADGSEHPLKGKSTSSLYPQGVTRETVGRYHVGFNYENNVQAQQAREGITPDFKKDVLWPSKEHPEGVGKHDDVDPRIIQHVPSGREYLQVRPHTDPNGKVRKEHEQWRDNATGRILPQEEVKDIKKNLLPGGNSKPAPAAQGGIAKKIPVRAIPLADIYAMRASHEKGWKNINQAAHDDAAAEPVRLSHDLILARGGANLKPCRATMCNLMRNHDADCDKWDADDKSNYSSDPVIASLANDIGLNLDLQLGDVAGHEFHGNQYSGGQGGLSTTQMAAQLLADRPAQPARAVQPAQPARRNQGVKNPRDSIKKEKAWDHEKMRIRTMDTPALARRINKIKNKDKLNLFADALESENYHVLAHQARHRAFALSHGRNLMLMLSGKVLVLTDVGALVLGDSPGHPFRGNQFMPGGEEHDDKKNSEQNYHAAAGDANKATREAKTSADHARAADLNRKAAAASDAVGLPNQGVQFRRQAEAHDRRAAGIRNLSPEGARLAEQAANRGGPGPEDEVTDSMMAARRAGAGEFKPKQVGDWVVHPVTGERGIVDHVYNDNANAKGRLTQVDYARGRQNGVDRDKENHREADIVHSSDQKSKWVEKPYENGKPGSTTASSTAKLTPQHTDPIYHTRAKLPKYNGTVNVLQAGYSEAGKMLRQRMPGTSRDEHIMHGDVHLANSRAMDKQHRDIVDRATKKIGAKNLGPLISGIVSNNFSTKTKNKLRDLAHGASASRSAAMAHWAAGGLQQKTALNKLHA